MRKFYLFQKGQSMIAELSQTHYIQILSINNIHEINYYINISIEQNLSVRELHNKIKSKEYQRIDEETKKKLLTHNDNNQIQDFIKHPILIKNQYNYINISEKILKQLILEDISSFMKELGQGFCFIDDEYKIKIGDRTNYIDILLYNIKFNCYVVVELKVTELKKEYIGQIKTYMNYMDKNIKNINQDKTIGIIICKKDNKFIMEYCSDKRIYRTTYELINV